MNPEMSEGCATHDFDMIWQCGVCGAWHLQAFPENAPRCTLCDANYRQWMATLPQPSTRGYEITKVLLRKLIECANRAAKPGVLKLKGG